MGGMTLKSPDSRLFTEPFIQGADQRKHQSSASLAFFRRIRGCLVNSPHKGTVTRKKFPFGDVIMNATNGNPHVKLEWQNAQQNIHVCFKTLFKDQTIMDEGTGVLDTKDVLLWQLCSVSLRIMIDNMWIILCVYGSDYMATSIFHYDIINIICAIANRYLRVVVRDKTFSVVLGPVYKIRMDSVYILRIDYWSGLLYVLKEIQHNDQNYVRDN